MATYDPEKGHAALRRGRWSQPWAEYFLTLCTSGRQSGLSEPLAADAILQEIHAMSADTTWTARCAVVMPDHLHLLMVMGERLSLGQTVQRLKARSSHALRAEGLVWERDYFDRQIRPNDDRLAVFRYIYLNPYRPGLLSLSDKWAYYYCREEDWVWFRDYMQEERPYPEWLR